MELIFKGKTKTEPKIDMNEKNYSIKKNEEGKVVDFKFKTLGKIYKNFTEKQKIQKKHD